MLNLDFASTHGQENLSLIYAVVGSLSVRLSSHADLSFFAQTLGTRRASLVKNRRFSRLKTATVTPEGEPMSFGLYSIGFAIVIGGLIYAAYLLHLPAHWIAVGAVILLGVGILTGVKATRQKDPVG
jgi:hypothetical protein